MPKKKKRAPADIIITQLKKGKDNASVLKSVRKSYPDSHLSLSSVNFYRNALRRDGLKIPTDKQALRLTGNR